MEWRQETPTKEDWATVLLTSSFFPVWEDPFHREGKIPFWIWFCRELWELRTGIELLIKRLRGEL